MMYEPKLPEVGRVRMGFSGGCLWLSVPFNDINDFVIAQEHQIVPLILALVANAEEIALPREGFFVGPELHDKRIQRLLYELQQALKAKEGNEQVSPDTH
jgi:hypothetical protein